MKLKILKYNMRRPWSITTTLRNPERLRNFLIVLKQMENLVWNYENQKKYQILLIKERVYGYGNNQFYSGLSQEQIDLIDDQKREISFMKAEEIFSAKKYEDPAMRGRQSINPLKKIGLVVINDNKIAITDLGRLFLKEDFDLGEAFFRSFLKWQIPNLDNRDYSDVGIYDIKPFIGTLHLIKAVNEKELGRGNETKGLSKKEFSLFVPTLVNYRDIDKYASKIIELRDFLANKDRQEQRTIFEDFKNKFISDFLNSTDQKIILSLLKNLSDYGDNTIRYFRLTRYLYIRGGGYYIDLEPRRSVEIDSLLSFDNARSQIFKSKKEYLDYISDISQPKLPWETQEKYIQIIQNLTQEIELYEQRVGVFSRVVQAYESFSEEQLKDYINDLRTYRRELQDQENHDRSQQVVQIQEYVNNLENIYKLEDRPVVLEKYVSLGLNALNDALRIKPNYPVGDDNEPTFTAPANTPDIECFYESYNSICEVTMLKGRDQWYNEGQPVMRHLRDFEHKYNEKAVYCLFVAPQLHRDTINTFWTAVKYEYEGQRQRIVPLSIKDFISLLKILLEMKKKGKYLRHNDLLRLYDEILNDLHSYSDSAEWVKKIPEKISLWQNSLQF